MFFFLKSMLNLYTDNVKLSIYLYIILVATLKFEGDELELNILVSKRKN